MNKVTVSVTVADEDGQTQSIEAQETSHHDCSLALATVVAVRGVSYRLAMYPLVFARSLIDAVDLGMASDLPQQLRGDFERLADKARNLIAKADRVRNIQAIVEGDEQ